MVKVDETKIRDQLIFDLITRRFEIEINRRIGLDQKASSLIGFEGIIVGIFSAGTGLLFPQNSDSGPPFTFILFALIGLGILGVSLLLSLYAFRLREWQSPPDTEYLLREYTKKTWIETLRANAVELSKALVHNTAINDNKAKYVKASWSLLVIGITDFLIFMFNAVISGASVK